MKSIRNESGILHLPMALLTVIFVVTGLGLWGILHHWKDLAQTQLRLDRCTGETALDLKSKLQTIDSANKQMTALRLSEAAAPNPATIATIKLAVEAEALRQESARSDWALSRLSWAAQIGCSSRGDSSTPLPALSWTRDPPDALGSQPLRLEELPKSYRIQLTHLPRASAAEVSAGDPNDRTSWQISWHARWIPPQRIVGSGIY